LTKKIFFRFYEKCWSCAKKKSLNHIIGCISRIVMNPRPIYLKRSGNDSYIKCAALWVCTWEVVSSNLPKNNFFLFFQSKKLVFQEPAAESIVADTFHPAKSQWSFSKNSKYHSCLELYLGLPNNKSTLTILLLLSLPAFFILQNLNIMLLFYKKSVDLFFF
jgi:hypothetical protein